MDPYNELYLYVEQLLFLIGTLLYGFLARELLRRHEVLPGNWPVRLMVISLTVWFGGTLLDQTLDMLLGHPASFTAAVGLDLARAFAWLLSLPLLAHTLAKILAAEGGHGTGADLWRWLPLPAYLTLGLFFAPAVAFARSAQTLLSAAIPQVYPRIVLHAVVSLSLAAVLTARVSRSIDDRRLLGFLRALAVILATLLALLVTGGFFDPWAEEAAGLDRLLRTLLLGDPGAASRLGRRLSAPARRTSRPSQPGPGPRSPARRR